MKQQAATTKSATASAERNPRVKKVASQSQLKLDNAKEACQTPPTFVNKGLSKFIVAVAKSSGFENGIKAAAKSQSPTKKKLAQIKKTHHRRQASLNLVSSQNPVSQRAVRDILMKFTTPQIGSIPSKPLQDETYCEDEDMVISKIPHTTTLHTLVNAGRGRARQTVKSPFGVASLAKSLQLKNEEMSVSPINSRVSQIKHLSTYGLRQQQNFSKIIEESSFHKKIQILVRVRPALESEDPQECLECYLDTPGSIRLHKEYQSIHFKFDSIIAQSQGQDQMFARIQGIVDSFNVGVNGTIFAYGQTGAGKTYSIMGSENSWTKQVKKYTNQLAGVLPRTLQHLFGSNIDSKCQYSISFFEIYNDRIYDLLDAQESPFAKKRSLSKNTESNSFGFSNRRDLFANLSRKSLELRQEHDGQFSVADLRRVQIKNIEEARYFLNFGLAKRATNSTSMNNQSSRSHSIFQIYLEKEVDNGIVLRSKLRIVDLAGSEKYTLKKDMSQQEKLQRVQELTSINSSLSALGLCISALSEINHKKSQGIHVPYRNSKLTRVLKDSLDETSNVVLIVCISPSLSSYKETLSTLQFADRAKRAVLDGKRSATPPSQIIRDHSNRMLNPTGSQISLLFNPSSISGGSNAPSEQQVNHIVRAYEEEKAIRRGLQQIQNEVIEENVRLKKLNLELLQKLANSKVEESLQISEESFQLQNPAIIKSCFKPSIVAQILKKNHQEINNDLKRDDQSEIIGGERDQDLISINIIPIMGGKVKHGSRKTNFNGRRKKRVDNLLHHHSTSPFAMKSQAQEMPDQDKGERRVRFAEKLDNDSSLDSSMRERIEHNLKYNDDTIFDNISIFRDLNGSGIVHTKKVAEKERYPKKTMFIEDTDEDDKPEVASQIENEGKNEQLQKDQPSPPLNENNLMHINNQLYHQQQLSVLEDQSGGGQEFWSLMNGSDHQRQQQYQQNSSQQISIIEQQQQQPLPSFLGVDGAPSMILNNSGIQISYIQPGELIEELQKDQCNDFSKDFIELGNDHILGDKDQSSSSFIEQSAFQYPNAAAARLETSDDKILVFDLEENNQLGNLLGDNQTLILDSQSILIDEQQQQDQPSIMMNNLEASSILQDAPKRGGLILDDYLEDDSDSCAVAAALSSNLGDKINILQQTSNNGQSSLKEEIAFSLTNTFSTIQSLREELAVIRRNIDDSVDFNGDEEVKEIMPLQRSLKRNESMNSLLLQPHQFKKIHRYAEEAATEEDNLQSFKNFTSESYVERKRGRKSHSLIMIDGEGDEGSSAVSPEILKSENKKAINGIKGFYSKIHEEITQLKNILLEETPSEQLLQSQPPVPPQLILSVETIDRAQSLISQLRQELLGSLHIQTNAALPQTQQQMYANPSQRVLELLEQLQQSFQIQTLAAVTSTAKVSYPKQLLPFDNQFNPQKLIQYEPIPSPTKTDNSGIVSHSRINSNLIGQQLHIQVYENNEYEDRTPEVYKGLASVICDNQVTERKRNDQTLTLVFDSSDEEQEQQRDSSLNFEQDISKPPTMTQRNLLLFTDDKGLNIDPIQNLSGNSSSLQPAQLQQQRADSFFQQQNNSSIINDQSLLGLAQEMNPQNSHNNSSFIVQNHSFQKNNQSGAQLLSLITPNNNSNRQVSPPSVDLTSQKEEIAENNNQNTTPITSKVSVHKYWNQYFKNNSNAVHNKNQLSK